MLLGMPEGTKIVEIEPGKSYCMTLPIDQDHTYLEEHVDRVRTYIEYAIADMDPMPRFILISQDGYDLQEIP